MKDFAEGLQKSHKSAQEKLAKHGIDTCRNQKLFSMQGTVFYNLDWNNNQRNCKYLITEVYDFTDLNHHLKQVDYKAETVFWEYTRI